MDYEANKAGRTMATDVPPLMGRTPKEAVDIPDYLIYEVLDGIPVYYAGWETVIEKTKTPEEIMGYGDYQTILLTYIKDFLFPLLGQEWLILQGETGLHLNFQSNPSIDLCIYPRKALSLKKAKNKYLDTPPNLVVEVDTKADVANFETQKGNNYYILKTKKLLDFGVEQVIWVFTQDEKVMVASPHSSWLTLDWQDPFDCMGHRFSIRQIIEASEKDPL